MKRKRIAASFLAIVVVLSMLLSACSSQETESFAPENSSSRQPETTSGDSSSPAVSGGSATLGQIADYLMTAADDYNPELNRSSLLEGLEGGESAPATRLQALAMVSRAFGTLPAPTGNNERLASKDVDLSGVPEWAKADLENLFTGGVLAPTDLGQEDTSAVSGEGAMLADDAGLPAAPTEEGAESDTETGLENNGEFGLATPDGDTPVPEGEEILGGDSSVPTDSTAAVQGLDAPVSLRDVETYSKRIFALFGSNLKDDFYANVNKADLESLEIPQGQTSAGGSKTVEEETNEKVRQIIREIVESGEDYASGSSEQKIRDFYRSALAKRPGNTDALNEWFDRIDQASTLAQLREVQAEIVKQLGLTNNGLLNFTLSNDLTDPTKKVLSFISGLMVMSVEDYEDPESDSHKQYRSELVGKLKQAGENEDNAERIADAMIALELEQLKNGMTAEEAADLSNYNNTFTMDELEEMMPELGVKEFLTGLGFQESLPFQVYDVKAFRIMARHMNETELSRLKAQVKLNLLENNRELLTGELEETEALDLVSAYLSDEVGKLYVERWFPAEAKAGVQKMVDQLVEAFKARIGRLDWMADETKQEALKKLETLTVLIGYPDEWPDSRLRVTSPEDGGTYFENMAAIGREKLRQDVENQNGGGDAFGLPAYLVNAAANRQSNTLVFPAGILQAPFYDPAASFEENLGGIGAIIAHEISHTFDDQGAQYDSSGAVRNWWGSEDYAHFQELCKKAEDAYNGAEAAPGITVNGKDTLSENIADIAGAASAMEVLSSMDNADYDAFFRSYAKCWLLVTDRENTAMMAESDEHAPKSLRVNKVLQNFQEFFDTYGISEGDGMYLTPEDRVKIW